jgi:hypothetical protein
MKVREEINISNIYHKNEKLNISSHKNFDIHNRPISANLKRPDSKLKINHSILNGYNTPLGNNMGVSNNFKGNNLILSHTESHMKKIFSSKQHISNGLNMEKERLYEDTIHLKNTINDLRKDLGNLKSENHKLSLEMNKKDKLIEEMIKDNNNNLFVSNNMHLNESKSMSKAKETHLFVQIKKQFKDLKNEYKSKCIELDNLKKNIKLTKFNEIGIELKTYMDELARIKSLYLVTSKQNEINENKLKDYENIHQNFVQQQMILMNLQETLMNYENEIKIKNEEINEMKNKINNQIAKIKKLNADYKLSNQINEKLTKEKKDITDEKAKIKLLEKKIFDIKNDLSFYKDGSEKKDRKIRELEINLKTFNDKNNNKNNIQYNVESIRNIQENPEDKIDKTIMVLRSKLNESTQNYEKVLKKNKVLEERIYIYENNYELQDNGKFFLLSFLLNFLLNFFI